MSTTVTTSLRPAAKRAGVPTFSRKNDQTTHAQREGFTKCLAAGVRIAFGTDSGIYPHDLNARQFAYQVRCGQSTLGAIQSATINAAELIRWDDRVGRIEPGYLADVIAVNDNPLQDIRLLENAVFVMKDGAVLHRGVDQGSGFPNEPQPIIALP